jgi:molybdopterin molybdotransferase
MSGDPPDDQLRDLPTEVARARMLAGITALPAQNIPLDEALGRVLAEDLAAERDQPPFDASAMDGWAVRGGGERFEIVGESAAGHGFAGDLATGQTVRIFTGAPVPAGADRVVVQEVAVRDAGRLRVPPAAPEDPRYIRPAGGDFRAGAVLLRAGVRLDPWRLALAAAAGRAALSVTRRPKVVILATGEELAAPGARPRPDQIFDSAGPALAALISSWGGEPVRLASEGDDAEAIADAVAGAGGDLIVTLGGASVGDHDLVKPALARLGLALRVETVRLRPGKPTWFGSLTDGRPALGLPGNPASALACAELFLRPVLHALLGAPPGPRLETARLAMPMPANGGREHWARARLSAEDGLVLARPLADQDSSLVSVFAEADALIRRPVGAPASAAGDVVDILRLARA